MNRVELLERVVELEQEIRELKAKGESGHCFGCLCRTVIYYPDATFAPVVQWQWQAPVSHPPVPGTVTPKP